MCSVMGETSLRGESEQSIVAKEEEGGVDRGKIEDVGERGGGGRGTDVPLCGEAGSKRRCR